METTYDKIYTENEAQNIINGINKNIDNSLCVSEELVGGATLETDVVSHDNNIVIHDIDDPNLGVSISHIHKVGTGSSPYGKNFRLNLDEKLERLFTEKNELYYVYTDNRGNKHLFEESFYKIDNNGVRSGIDDIASIVTNADGALWLNGERVYRELVSRGGKRVVADIVGVNNAEWIETRENEVKQLEEQKKGYYKELMKYAAFNGTSISITEEKIADPDEFEEFLRGFTINADLYLLSDDEITTYKSLSNQKDSCVNSRASLMLQKQSIINSIKRIILESEIKNGKSIDVHSLDIQKRMLNIEASNDSLSSTEEALIGTSTDNITSTITRYSVLNEQISNATKSNLLLIAQVKGIEMSDLLLDTDYSINYNTSDKGILVRQLASIDLQIKDVDEQLRLIRAAMDKLAGMSNDNVELLKKYYKEYLNISARLEALYMQIPKSYLVDGDITKGFNVYGELAVIYRGNGSYVAIERERTSLTEYKTRITSLYDNNENRMSFVYYGNFLHSITSSCGERIEYIYTMVEYLNIIKREKLYNCLGIGYTSDYITTIRNQRNVVELSYDASYRISTIIGKTEIASVSNGVVEEAEEYAEISRSSFTYTDTSVKVAKNGESTVFIVSEDTVLGFYRIKNGKILEAEKYGYDDNKRRNSIEVAYPELLTEASALNFVNGTGTATLSNKRTLTLSIYNSIKSVTAYKYALDGTQIEKCVQTNTYDIECRLLSSTDAYTIGNKNYRIITNYYYNDNGCLARKESYVKDEEYITGINVEEYIYNDNGVEIGRCSYNTLDSSTKFYTESRVDNKGRVIATLDATGENATAFEYEADGVTVKAEILPNGSKLAYGRDDEGVLTSITASTEEGEGNSIQRTYTEGHLTSLTDGINTINYTYDNKGRPISVSVNGVEDYATYSYGKTFIPDDTLVVTLKDGTSTRTVRDSRGNIISMKRDDLSLTNTYSEAGILQKSVDSAFGTRTYQFDMRGRIELIGNEYGNEVYEYNDRDKVTIRGVHGQMYFYTYSEDSSSKLESISVYNTVITPRIDVNGRNVGKKITNGETVIEDEHITYLKVGDHATNLPSTVRHKTGITRYKYDNMGNICEVYENGRLAVRYTYDALGRLVREDNRVFSSTVVYVYDNVGNILFNKKYSFTLKEEIELEEMSCTTTEYIYNGCQLSFKYRPVIYNEMGNPISFGGYTLTWTHGNRLASFGDNTFTYDTLGNRITKNNTRYFYDNNGNLVAEITGSVRTDYLYDHTGMFAMKRGDVTYYYRKNPQGDITALLDSNGNIVVQYKYNAWGECKVLNASGVIVTDTTHIGHINPHRYRSYYYDTETGLYYLKSRYYDPSICRFISMDDIAFADPDSINGLNLYAYCGNNPVMNVDPNGNAFVSILIGLGIAALIGAGASAISYTAVQVAQYAVTGDFDWSWGGFLGSVIGGALAGAISYIPFLNPIIASALGGFAISAGGMIGENISDNKGYSVMDILVTSGISALLAGVSAGIMNHVKDPIISMGRNSYKAIEAQIFTKFRNGTISRITLNTFMKIFAYSLYKDIPGIFFDLSFEQSGLKNFLKKVVP